jgi:ABC-type multidrug transport system permease subunit
MQQHQDLKLNPSKFFTVLHVSAYSAIIRYAEIWGNCAFCVNAVGIYVFTMFLNEVNLVPPSVPHVLSFLVYLLPTKCAVSYGCMINGKQLKINSSHGIY